MRLLRTRLAGVERCSLDGCGSVVGAGLAVLVGLGLEGVFVLGVFAGELDRSLGERPASDDERGASGAGGEDGAAEGGEEHCGDELEFVLLFGLRLMSDGSCIIGERTIGSCALVSGLFLLARMTWSLRGSDQSIDRR
jgi:hypothetical protein